MSEESHVDALSASLSIRSRQHVANHVRSIQEQTLDVLLRIEELLQPKEPSVEMTMKGELVDYISPITPKETPLLETLKEEPKPTAGKRKGSRQL